MSSSTASNYLAKLVESNLIVAEQWGRYRYFRIANPAVVQALEALALSLFLTTSIGASGGDISLARLVWL